MPSPRRLLPRLAAISPPVLSDETLAELYGFVGDCAMWLQCHYREQLQRVHDEYQRVTEFDDNRSSTQQDDPF